MIKNAIKKIAYEQDCSISEATYIYNNPIAVVSHAVKETKGDEKTQLYRHCSM